MRLRISNGHSYAVEFSAGSTAEFRSALRRAAFEYFAHESRRAGELHVGTDTGDWLSPYYPRSNAPCVLRFGDVERIDWATCQRSNAAGTWFDVALCGLGRALAADRTNG
ncbi:MAG: hypothetical protein L6Q83_08180 [Gammaproteobacteria bacterium]|nr:hypothetical protein [Gammaproteobacteria bacterium]